MLFALIFVAFGAAFAAVFGDAGLVTGLLALNDLGILQPIQQSINQFLAGFGLQA